MKQSPWDRRIQRAEELATAWPHAAEILRFYIEIARFQKAIYDAAPTAETLPRHFPALLSLVRRVGPPALANDSDSAAAKEFFDRCLSQPLKEYEAGQADRTPGAIGPACPFCHSRPVAGVLRGEGDGAKRSLLCSLCATEWEYRRIVCPNCGEEDKEKLPIYRAPEIDHVRIEACDTCRTYIKSVDLTKNGRAIPVVDELASVALTIWAEEHNYAKLERNLLGM
jgi:FdhE protein